MNLYKSRAWQGIEKIAWFQSEPQINKIFEFVEVMRGFQSDSKWGLDVIPASLPPELQKALDSGNTDTANAAVAKIAGTVGGGTSTTPPQDLQELLNVKTSRVNKLLDFLWSDARMQGKLASTLIHTYLKGTGIIKSTFDPDNVGDSGIGQIETSVVDPLYFYPDPDATSMHDGSFYIEKHPVSVRWIIERYPDQAEEFLKSASGSDMDTAPRGNKAKSKSNPNEGKQIDILECWYKDSAVIQDDLTGKITAEYPNGRYTLMTMNEITLEDKPSEYETFHPYVRIVEIPMPNEFWGDCTVDKVAELQILINQIIRSIIDNSLWMVHGIWVADDTSGVTPESLAGYGMRDVVIKRAGSEVRRDVGEPLPATIFQTYEDLVAAFDIVAGIPNAMRGIVPSRQPVETTKLQMEAGEVRTRERNRQVEEGLEDLGKLWLSIVGSFWSDKRTIRNKSAVGGFDMFQLSKKDFEGWQFDLMVKPGSTTPLDTQAAFDRAKMMRMELQIPIPDEVFIRFAQIPGLEAAVAQVNAEAKASADTNTVPYDQASEFAGADAPPDEQGDGNQFPDPMSDPELSGLPNDLASNPNIQFP
jgi:hypothetical protein